jgi:hypothetical protein
MKRNSEEVDMKDAHACANLSKYRNDESLLEMDALAHHYCLSTAQPPSSNVCVVIIACSCVCDESVRRAGAKSLYIKTALGS